MTEEGHKGGLVSWVKNTHSGKRYVISTAKEIGQDFWLTRIHPRYFFGLVPNIFKTVLAFHRQNRIDARATHWEAKELVIGTPEGDWIHMTGKIYGRTTGLTE